MASISGNGVNSQPAAGGIPELGKQPHPIAARAPKPVCQPRAAAGFKQGNAVEE